MASRSKLAIDMRNYSLLLAGLLFSALAAHAGEKTVMHCFAWTPVKEATPADWEAFYKASDEYAWQAADVMPFINATDTLNWTEPSDRWKQPKDARAAQADGRDTRSRDAGAAQTSSGGYSDATGGLLLIYKLLVLAPVLAAARLAWNAARARREGTR